MEIELFTQDTKLFLPAIQRETQNWNLCHYQHPKTAPVLCEQQTVYIGAIPMHSVHVEQFSFRAMECDSSLNSSEF